MSCPGHGVSSQQKDADYITCHNFSLILIFYPSLISDTTFYPFPCFFFTFSYHICTFEIGKAKEKGREGKERKGKGRAGKGMAGQSMAGQGGEGKGRMTRK